MVRTENKISNKRVYAYRRITASPDKKPVTQKFSYLYIGKKFKTAFETNEGFETSHFVFAFDEAIRLLARLQKSNNLPSLILVDSPADIVALRKFLASLTEVEAYNALPVLVDVSCCRSEVIAALSMEKGITDLVTINSSSLLLQKASFFSRLQTNPAIAAKAVNEGFSWDIIRTYGPVRAFDVLFASIGILLMSPLMILLGILVKLDGGNTILEYSSATGLRYQGFRYLRFRTELSYSNEQIADLCHLSQFHVTDHRQGPFEIKGNQASKVGAFLRATNLAELPALFNILAGDISFIKSR